MGPLNYLPLTLPFFAALVAVFVAFVVFIEIRALRYAYLRVGVSFSSCHAAVARLIIR